MEPTAATEGTAGVEAPGRIAGVDWYLVGTDSTAAGLFVAGLLAFLVGLPALGLGLWASCVWLDWRVLGYLRTTPADAIRLHQYVNRRITSNGIAQVLAIALGFHLAISGRAWSALGIWLVAAAGVACSRRLSRVGGVG